MAEAFAAPQKIGRYDIKRILATGNMGDVYQATTLDERTRVPIYFAIKVLNPKVAKRLDYVQRFRADVKDECVQEYVEIDYDQKVQYYFVCHYLEVKPISRTVLRRERSPEIVDLFVRAATALDKAHGKKYIHGNIKASNLLIRRAKDENGKEAVTPILSDFGMTYIYEAGYFSGPRVKSVLSYMAPERLEQFVSGADGVAGLTAASDVYSLGAVLAEALSGSSPFGDAENLDALRKAKAEKKYLMLHVNHPVRRVDIKQLNEVLRRCLSPDPGGRFASAAEFASALAACKVAAAPAAAAK
jgi:serine/threonine-protein kinase